MALLTSALRGKRFAKRSLLPFRSASRSRRSSIGRMSAGFPVVSELIEEDLRGLNLIWDLYLTARTHHWNAQWYENHRIIKGVVRKSDHFRYFFVDPIALDTIKENSLKTFVFKEPLLRFCEPLTFIRIRSMCFAKFGSETELSGERLFGIQIGGEKCTRFESFLWSLLGVVLLFFFNFECAKFEWQNGILKLANNYQLYFPVLRRP